MATRRTCHPGWSEKFFRVRDRRARENVSPLCLCTNSAGADDAVGDKRGAAQLQLLPRRPARLVDELAPDGRGFSKFSKLVELLRDRRRTQIQGAPSHSLYEGLRSHSKLSTASWQSSNNPSGSRKETATSTSKAEDAVPNWLEATVEGSEVEPTVDEQGRKRTSS